MSLNEEFLKLYRQVEMYIDSKYPYTDSSIYEHIKKFSENTLDKSIFIIVGHSYEFEVLNEWDKIENLLKYIKSFDSFEVLTFKDAVKKLRK